MTQSSSPPEGPCSDRAPRLFVLKLSYDVFPRAMVTRRVSEGRSQRRFLLAYAAGCRNSGLQNLRVGQVCTFSQTRSHTSTQVSGR